MLALFGAFRNAPLNALEAAGGGVKVLWFKFFKYDLTA
jgi:hypothetical protein